MYGSSDPDWARYFDKSSGYYYYYNHRTGESVWEEVEDTANQGYNNSTGHDYQYPNALGSGYGKYQVDALSSNFKGEIDPYQTSIADEYEADNDEEDSGEYSTSDYDTSADDEEDEEEDDDSAEANEGSTEEEEEESEDSHGDIEASYSGDYYNTNQQSSFSAYPNAPDLAGSDQNDQAFSKYISSKRSKPKRDGDGDDALSPFMEEAFKEFLQTPQGKAALEVIAFRSGNIFKNDKFNHKI
jgi:WW domain